MTVRPARPGDLEAMGLLWDQLDAEQAPWRVFRPRPGIRDEVLRGIADGMRSPRALVVVAELDGEVVGMAKAATIQPSSFSDEEAVELSSVVVRDDRRGRGIGTALVREAARFAAERGVGRLTLRVFERNEGAVRFWRAAGFEPRFVQLTADPAELVRNLDPDRE